MRLSLDKLVRFWSMKYPDRYAICSPSASITYRELNKLAESYTFTSLPDNVRIGVAINDIVSYIAIILAMMRERKVFVNIESLIPKERLPEYLHANNIKTIITDDPTLISDNGIITIQLDDVKNDGWCFDNIPQEIEDVVGGFLSSGTTGTSKIYYRNQYSLISEAILWIMELGLTHNTTFYISKPFSYIGSFVLMYSILYIGGAVYVPESFKQLRFPNSELEFAFLTPSDIRSMMYTDLKLNCKNIITMGAPISPDEKISFFNKYHCNVYEMWGNSEGLATITNIYDDPECKSLGRATFTDSIFAVDINTKQQLPFNSIGIIAGITDNGICSSSADEVILSEDIGYIDESNSLHLIGRISDVIVFRDNSYFSTTEFENEIRQKCGITELAVLLTNRTVYIFIQKAKEFIDESRIEKLFFDLYGDYQEELNYGKSLFIDKLPYSNNGKVDYYQLHSLIPRI